MWGKWRAVNTLWMHTYQEIKTPSGVWPSPGDWTFAGLFFLQGSFWCCGSACCTGWGSRVAALLWAAAAPDPPGSWEDLVWQRCNKTIRAEADCFVNTVLCYQPGIKKKRMTRQLWCEHNFDMSVGYLQLLLSGRVKGWFLERNN